MLAKNLVREIIRRGGTAEIVQREHAAATCVHCGTTVRKQRVLNMNGPDYEMWFALDRFDDDRECEHEGLPAWEVVGELSGHDVHMFLQYGGQPNNGGNTHFTVRSIARRGEYDLTADYNGGGWTFCNRLRDLDWAVR